MTATMVFSGSTQVDADESKATWCCCSRYVIGEFVPCGCGKNHKLTIRDGEMYFHWAGKYWNPLCLVDFLLEERSKYGRKKKAKRQVLSFDESE